MKRLLSGVLLICMAVSMLSGCGGSNSALNDDTSKEVKLTWIVVGDQPKDMPQVLEQVNKYLKEKINATVDTKFIGWGDYEAKMITTASSGDAYDLCFTSYWMFDYRRYARQGFFYGLDELMDKYGEGIKKSVDVMPNLIDATKINGVVYGIPVANAPYQSGYYFNKNIVDKYKFDYAKVTRIEDLFPLYAKIKTDNPNIVCIADLKEYNADDKFDWIMGASFPGAVKVADKNCKVINQFTDPEYIAVLVGRREANLKGYTYKDTVNKNKDNDYKAGKLAGYVGTYTPGGEVGFNAVGDKPPTLIFPTYKNPTGETRNAAMGAMLAMSVGCKNPERAMKFINMLYTDAILYNLLSYGIEGTHYAKSGDTTIKFLPAHKDYAGLVDWTYGNKMVSYVPDGEPADKWKLMRQGWDSVVWSPIFGFSADLAPVQNEVSALTNITKQYETDLQAGTRDVEPLLKEYNEKLQAAGMDKFMAEMQKQIDAWKKSKK